MGVRQSGGRKEKADDHLPGRLYSPAVHLRPHHRCPRRLLPGIRPDRRHRPDHHPDPDHLRRDDQFSPPRHPPLHAGRQPDERRRPYARPGEFRPQPPRAHPRRSGPCHDPGLRHLRGHLRGRRGDRGGHRGRHAPGHEEGGLRRGSGGGPDLYGLLPGPDHTAQHPVHHLRSLRQCLHRGAVRGRSVPRPRAGGSPDGLHVLRGHQA